MLQHVHCRTHSSKHECDVYNAPISSHKFSNHTVLLYKLSVRNNNKSLISCVRRDDRIKSSPFPLPFFTRVNNFTTKRVLLVNSTWLHYWETTGEHQMDWTIPASVV